MLLIRSNRRCGGKYILVCNKEVDKICRRCCKWTFINNYNKKSVSSYVRNIDWYQLRLVKYWKMRCILIGFVSVFIIGTTVKKQTTIRKQSYPSYQSTSSGTVSAFSIATNVKLVVPVTLRTKNSYIRLCSTTDSSRTRKIFLFTTQNMYANNNFKESERYGSSAISSLYLHKYLKHKIRRRFLEPLLSSPINYIHTPNITSRIKSMSTFSKRNVSEYELWTQAIQMCESVDDLLRIITIDLVKMNPIDFPIEKSNIQKMELTPLSYLNDQTPNAMDTDPRITLLILNRLVSILLSSTSGTKPSNHIEHDQQQDQNSNQIQNVLLRLVLKSIKTSLVVTINEVEKSKQEKSIKKSIKWSSLGKYPTSSIHKFKKKSVRTFQDSMPLVNEYTLAECYVSISILANYYKRNTNQDSSSLLSSSASSDSILYKSSTNPNTNIQEIIREFDRTKELSYIASTIWNTLESRNTASQGKVVRQLSVRRLVKCLHSFSLSCTRETLFTTTASSSLLSNSSNFLYLEICQRLTHSDAIAQVSPSELSVLLRSLKNIIILQQQSCASDASLSHVLYPLYNLLLAIVRRCRKQVIRENSTQDMLLSILDSIRQLRPVIMALDHPSMGRNSSLVGETTMGSNETFNPVTNVISTIQKLQHVELPKLVYTTAMYLVYSETNNFRLVDGTKNYVQETEKQQQFTISGMVLIVSTVHEMFTTTLNSSDPLIHHIHHACCYRMVVSKIQDTTSKRKGGTDFLECTGTRIRNLARILVALDQWGFGQRTHKKSSEIDRRIDSRDDRANINKDAKDDDILYARFGYAFREATANLIVSSDFIQSSSFPTVDSRDVNTILRSAVLSNGHNWTVMADYWNSACMLFLNNNNHEFLKTCRMVELVNFVWFVSRMRFENFGEGSKHFNERAQILITLGNHILQSDHLHCVSPKLASRVLTAFTTAVNSYPNDWKTKSFDDRLSFLLSELFRVLGERLLTMQLSSAEVSSLLYSYAKASYFDDLGIFDHLMNIMARHLESNPGCTIRQVAQSLWSCGKAIEWESKVRLSGNDGITERNPVHYELPPYTANVHKLISHLSLRASEMTTRDISQSLWAIVQLQSLVRTCTLNNKYSFSDEFVVSDNSLGPILGSCENKIVQFTPMEVTSVLGSIYRLQKLDSNFKMSNQLYKTVFILTRPYTNRDKNYTCSPRQASSILYSLGQMNIRDEDVFSNLSSIIMNQIESMNAREIATVLYAHRSVHLTPPQQMLDRWAVEKLGLATVRTKQPQQQQQQHQLQSQSQSDWYDAMTTGNGWQSEAFGNEIANDEYDDFDSFSSF